MTTLFLAGSGNVDEYHIGDAGLQNLGSALNNLDLSWHIMEPSTLSLLPSKLETLVIRGLLETHLHDTTILGAALRRLQRLCSLDLSFRLRSSSNPYWLVQILSKTDTNLAIHTDTHPHRTH